MTPKQPRVISLRDARMLALHATGLHESSKPESVLDTIHVMGVLQIDSVNVFERAHYMPLFSRLGPYDKAELDNLHGGKHPKLIEYWAHEASFIRTEHYPFFGFRQEYNQRGSRTSYEKWAADNREFLDWIKNEIRTRGPLSQGDFEHERAVRKGSWWGWSDVKRALEYMFMYGEVVSGGRNGFKRTYALPEQVLPKRVLERKLDPTWSRKHLLEKASKALGVATGKDLADYFRQVHARIKPLIQELVDEKKLRVVEVEGWNEPAYVHYKLDIDAVLAEAKTTKHVTLLSPFDPLVWYRERAERLWNFFYRIEIYTPEPNRIYGYYTLPLLWRGKVVGRIDLKNDRQNKVLLVQSSWHEDFGSAADIKAGLALGEKDMPALAKDLAKHLREVANWQGCETIEVKRKGNLSVALAAQFR
jgi:uncharacterized protein YcaQ